MLDKIVSKTSVAFQALQILNSYGLNNVQVIVRGGGNVLLYDDDFVEGLVIEDDMKNPELVAEEYLKTFDELDDALTNLLEDLSTEDTIKVMEFAKTLKEK